MVKILEIFKITFLLNFIFFELLFSIFFYFIFFQLLQSIHFKIFMKKDKKMQAT